MKRVSPFKWFFALLFMFGVLVSPGCGGGGGGDSSPLSPTNDPAVLVEQERPAVNAKLNALAAACDAKNVDQVVQLCSPSTQERFKKRFQTNQAKLPKLAEALKAATLVSVAPASTVSGEQAGVVSVNVSGKTFHLNLAKRNGEWFFESM
ncbi:MAG: hypothetical protein WA705_15195 [Candidatus Ozemobacteraceae bacterium]